MNSGEAAIDEQISTERRGQQVKEILCFLQVEVEIREVSRRVLPSISAAFTEQGFKRQQPKAPVGRLWPNLKKDVPNEVALPTGVAKQPS